MKATLSFWSSLWLLMLFPAQAAQITLSSITHTNTIKGSDLLLLDSYLAPGSYTTRVITLSDFLATGGGGGGSGVFVANSHIITPTDLANATLHIGSGVSNWWGNSTDDAIVIVHDSSAGDSTAANWAIAATDSASNSTNYAFFGMAMSTGPQPFATITVAALTNSQELAAPSSHWNLYLQPDQNVARIQMVNQGTNTFDLGDTGALSIRDYLSLSGYTNQIGDNGSALTYNGVAVGGATIGDPFVVTSQLADNATNVAMVVDTSEPWSGGASLFKAGNHGTNVLRVGPDALEFTAVIPSPSGKNVIFEHYGQGSVNVRPFIVSLDDATNIGGDSFSGNTSYTLLISSTITNSGSGPALYWVDGNYGVVSEMSSGTSTGDSVAVFAQADGRTDIQYALAGNADDGKDNQVSIGVAGTAYTNFWTGGKYIGGYFEATKSEAVAPNFETSVLLLDNRTTDFPLIIARTNNGSHVFTVESNGSITSGGNTNQLSWKNAASGLTITASTTNAIIATIDGRKVYLLIANETPP